MPEQTAHDIITAPLGEPVTLETLPPPDTTRWVARRKAQVVAAVDLGLLTVDEALRRYKLTIEEFVSWRRALYRFGVRGLQVTGGRLRELAGERRTKQRAWSRPRRPSVAGHA
jgi:hypothetical protein